MPSMPISPNFVNRNQIESDASIDAHLCWTCSSCDLECPVNACTNRLRPQRLVRMASLGLAEELLRAPELWYCLACGRCNQICPNRVKPADLVLHLRRESLRRGLVTTETNRRFMDLFAGFQKVRWHAIVACMDREVASVTDRLWQKWRVQPISTSQKVVFAGKTGGSAAPIQSALTEAGARACFTCNECSNNCPIFSERALFDPLAIIRMANLGMVEELMSSPALWLCIGCQRCTNNCGQLVKGHLLIRQLAEMAVEQGFVPPDFPVRLERAFRLIYPKFLDEIDTLFGF